MDWRIRKFGGPWPSPHEELLLRAALGQGPEASRALAEWEADFDPRRIDHETLVLLPLLDRNLRAHGIASRFAGTYGSVYRWSWSRNQVLFAALGQVLRRLHEAKVATMLMKGAALSRSVYGDLGARAMGDCDLLVPPAQVDQAERVLREAGFAPVLPLGAGLFRTHHSAAFRDPVGREIDLHWHVLTEDIGPGADDGFWAAAEPLAWDGATTSTLCPADHLLLIVTHGALGGLNTAPVYWIADAVVLLRRYAGTMSWTRLYEQARERRLGLTVTRALDYLAARFDVPFGGDARADFAMGPVSAGERVEHWLKVRNAAGSPLGNLPRYWFTYTRLCRREGRAPSAIGFYRFVKDHRLVDRWTFARRALLWPARQLVWLVTQLLRLRGSGTRAPGRLGGPGRVDARGGLSARPRPGLAEAGDDGAR